MPYRLNKKKKPAPTKGKFLYHYYNDSEDDPHPHNYETIEVTEAEWEMLVAEDKKEYSNNRRHDEKKNYFDIEYEFEQEDNEEFYTPTNKKLLNWLKVEWEQSNRDFIEKLDTKRLVRRFTKENRYIYKLVIEQGVPQKEVAEQLNISEATVSRRVKIILQEILIERMNDGTYSPKRLKAEAEYLRYMYTGKTESFADVYAYWFLTTLDQSMVMRYLYCLFGTYQLFHYCFVFLCRFTISERLQKLNPERLVKLLEPYSQKLYYRYERRLNPIFKVLFIFLELKCTDNLKRVGLYQKPANQAFIKKVRQTANRCHISVDELKNQRILPFLQDEVTKRISEFRKAYNLSEPEKKPRSRSKRHR